MAEYIPLKTTTTDHDSTTKDPVNINKSTTIDEPTTITIDAKNPKPIDSNGGQRPLSPSPPPRPQLSKEEEGILGCILIMAMLVVCFVKIHIDNKEVSEYVPTVDPIIQLQAATFSIHNLSSSTITTKGEVSFIVTKPSDCTVAFYDTMVVSLFHMEKPLSIANMESFLQNESNHSMVKAIFPPTTAPLEKSESERMARDFNSGLSFEFSFDVNAKGRVWQNKYCILKVVNNSNSEQTIISLNSSKPHKPSKALDSQGIEALDHKMSKTLALSSMLQPNLHLLGRNEQHPSFQTPVGV